MRNRYAVIMAAVLVLVGLSAPLPAQALGKVKCDVNNQPAVAVGSYDPIVNHNGDGAGHEHQFFGNTAWHALSNPNTANYGDLVGQDNNCRPVLGLPYSADSAGYWIPTLRYVSGPRAGELVPAQQFTAYYRPAAGGKFGPARAMPADTRLVSEPGRYNWTCGQNSGARSAPVAAIPDCTGLSGGPGETLTAHIDFPSCWDGVLPNHSADDVGDTRDNAHYAYRSGKSCPAGFPIGVTELRETIQFDYQGNGADVALSSDEHAGTTDGQSLHGDFWQTWMQPEFEQFVRECINSRTNYSVAKCDP